MKNGDILCLENTRFHPGEEKNDNDFAKQLAALGDIFVDDAFSAAHRAHASNEAIVTVSDCRPMPAAPCRPSSTRWRRRFDTPEHPVTAIVGGAKISTKLDLLGNLLDKVETLIIGGGMANTFLAAQGKAIGKSLCEDDLDRRRAREIMAKAKALKREIVLPVDAVVAQKFAAHAPSRVVAVDAGRRSRHDPRHRAAQRRARRSRCSARTKTLVWNGPFGAFEHGTVRQRHGGGGGSGGGTHRGRQACQLCRRRRHGGGAQSSPRVTRPIDLRLDRRRRLPRMAGRQDAAGRRGAEGVTGFRRRIRDYESSANCRLDRRRRTLRRAR